MKKIYTLSLAGLLAGAVSAQQVNKPIPHSVKPSPSKTFQFDRSKLNKVKSNPSQNSTGNTWVCFGDVMDQVASGGAGMSGTSVLGSNYLNTDSLLYGNFGGTYAAIWLNHLGDVLDISSPYFTQILGTNWDHFTAYDVDSVAILYAYTRMDTAYVDTLVFTFFTNQTAANLSTYYFTGGSEPTDYGTDTLFFKAIKYTYTSNSVNATGKVVYKFPLTNADTAATAYMLKAFALPAPFHVNGGKMMGCAVTFKPGFPYSLGDSADTKNAFFFTSFEELGAGLFPSYTDCNYLSSACDYNCSHIIPNDVRYNINTGGWNGFFLPAYAYTAPYSFEHHLIYYNVSQTNVGIKENAENQFLVDQNIPNPFSGTAVIGYELKNAAKSVKFEIVDFAGRLVSSQTENNVKPGHNSFSVEGSKLSKGIYFYSVTVDGNRLTKKMIVE